MRIATLGISHETNTFSRVPADYGQFLAAQVLRGDEIADQYRSSSYTFAGYWDAADELEFDLVPLMYAQTGPIGTITKDAYDRLSGEMFGMLREGGPWDAVLITNHGAAVSEEFPDMDGEFTRAVREIVGPDVPVGVTLDMHANVSKAVVDHTDVCVVWRTNPHLDTRVRGRKTAELIYRTVKGEVRPVQWIEMTPMVVNIVKQFTAEEPMRSLVADAITANERPGILDTSVAEGYPYADVAEMGMSFIAIADGDPDAAREAAVWMARRGWEHREALNVEVPKVDEALRMAAERYIGPKPEGVTNPGPTEGSALEAPTGEGEHARLGPIVLMDVGDNIGGGSSADSTFILAEAQRTGFTGLLQSLYDPEAVEACVRAGVGSELTLQVGGKTDDMHGTPVRVTGTVRAITDGEFEETRPTHGGFRFYSCGTSIRLDTTDGHTLLLTSKRVGNTAREQMYHIGIWPEKYRVVVAKGVVSPRPAYQPIAAEVILVNTPGVTTADLDTFTYHHRRVPLYPFEEEATYEAE
ncbi:MAG: M81 family metallopeptidase [Chloroflexi bacterium]|nr:M81 family metallopeptidase [Chloroflexota bacterium]